MKIERNGEASSFLAEGAQDQREIKRLKQELRRKEKALAEAAALLIASKKIQAFWGVDGDD